jgi:uncharacterized protein
MFGFILAFVAGAVFGLGLMVGGMTDPANVQGFLDLAGAWRPQLLAVLGTAVAVAFVLYAVARRLGAPFAGGKFSWPTRDDLDLRLIAGSALFGIGWALAGYCPGPALTSLGALNADALAFVPAMAAGVWVTKRFG